MKKKNLGCLAALVLPFGSYGAIGSYSGYVGRKHASPTTNQKCAVIPGPPESELYRMPPDSSTSHDLCLEKKHPITELILIDASVPNKHLFYQLLKPGTDVVELDGNNDGLEQLLTTLESYRSLSALHIVSHAKEGTLLLGNSQIDAQSLEGNIQAFSQINKSVKPGGDILLYGCNLAADRAGEELLEIIVGNTHADVAASDDFTGAGSKEGDWDLEIKRGNIEASLPWSEIALKDFSDVLAPTTYIPSDFCSSGCFTASASHTSSDGHIVFDGSHIVYAYAGTYADSGLYLDYATTATAGFLQFSADGTNIASFQLTAVNFSAKNGASCSTANVIGYLAAGGTQSDSFTLIGAGSVALTNLAGEQLTKFRVSASGCDQKVYWPIRLNNFTVDNKLTSNTAPTLGGSFTTAGVVNDNATISPFSSVTVSDSDADNVSVSITYTGANGTLTGTGITGSAGSYTVTSVAPAEATTNLQGLTFTPTNNQSSSPVVSTFTLTPNDGTIDGTANATTQITANPVVPTVSSVSVPSNATYVTGENLDFTVNTSEAVTVVTSGGTPTLALTIGATSKAASYVSGSGTTALLFRYNVESGLSDTNGITLGGSISLNSGTMKDSGGSNLTTTLNSVGGLTSVLVDSTAPTVSSVSVPSNATYVAGQNLDFTVNTSEAVTVVTSGGTPTLALTIGATGKTASYVSGSGTTALLFRYTVENALSDTDGIALGASIALNSGTMKDAVGNNLTTTLNSVGSLTSVLVDSTAPTVASVSVPSNATYVAGQNLDFTVNTSEAVTVVTSGGTPTLALTIGATGKTASYVSGSGTTALLFRYTVESGLIDSDGIALGGSISLNSGTMKDAVTNDLSTTLNSVGSLTSVLVDSVVPTISSVTVPNSPMKVGDAVTVSITAGEAGLSLTTGTVNGVVVTAFSDLGSGNYSATYTVLDGGTDIAAGSPIPVNFVLADAAGNDSAAYTTAISQGADSIDANVPTISSVSIPNTAMKIGDAVTVSITASEAGLSLSSGSVNGVAVSGFSDDGGGSYSATYTIVEGNTDRAVGDSIPVSFVLQDAAGNISSTYTTAITQNADSIDANRPAISTVSIPNSAMKVGDAVTVSITASEAGLSLNSGTINDVAVTGFTDGGSGSYSATYTVAEGNTDRAAGDSIPVSFILQDSAGNNSTTYTTAIVQGADSIDANSPGSASGTLVVDENVSNGTTVGTVSASDATSYSLFDDAGGRFAIASGTGIVTVADGSLLNYEANSSHNITVRVTDAGGNTTDTVLAVTVNNVNEAPVITNLDGDAVSFNIGGGATVLDDAADASLTDGDSADFNGGNITVSIVANQQSAEDVLQVGAVGNIATSGSNITHSDGFTIGTAAGGTGGTSLVITLNVNATLARVQDLLSALQYTNTNASTTSTAAKTVRVTANDGDGASAISANQDVTVSLVRAPIIDLDGDDSSGNTSGGYNGSFTEDGGAVAVADSDNTISDDGTFKSLTVTLSNRPDTTAESLASTLGTGGQTVNSEAVTIAAYDGGTGVLTITVDDGSASAATMQQLIASTRYNNTSSAPDTTNRSVTFVAVDNADNTGVESTSTISVTATNDQPVFSGLDGTPAFTEDGAAVVLDSNVVVADAELDDTDNYSAATLTLVRNGGASSYDQFSASGSLSALIEGGAFNLGGADIGTVTTNSAGTLLVTFNASATAANVDSVLQSIAYSNSNNSPASTTQIDWTFNDGNSGSQGSGGALTATGSTTVAITETNDSPTGSVTISGSPLEYQTLTAVTTALADPDGLGSFSYQWKSAASNVGSNSASYALTATDIGNTMTVTVSYTDGNGNAESVLSTASTVVMNVNDLPGGSVTISGTATEDQTLTASNTLTDADGLGSISYQWKRGGTNIGSATNSTYTLGDNDVGQTITVTASYTDGFGTAESSTSSATSAVVNVNDAPTGSVTISGTATEDQTLTAANTLADADGLGTITYQWQRAGTDITGATNSTYVLGDNDVGQSITVTASYTDAQGTAESSTSSATSAVVNVNDAPTGSVTISGTVTEDQTLTAINTLADADGLGTITYQWLRGGSAVSGATSSTYVLGDSDVGQSITVTASYTDNHGTAESVTSSATATVANVNDSPTGSVSFTGTEVEGYTLTASNTLADIDGLGSVSYQWQRGASNISGATSSTYTLIASDVGGLISVVASYVDGQGFSESVSSSSSGVIDGDLDGDGTGDASDTDIDGDGMLNSYEDANGLNKLDASDRDTDLDGDGVLNYDESEANSNANADDQPPVVTVPGDVNVNATGLFTAVTTGLVTAEDYKDGPLTPRVTQIVSNSGTAKALTSNPGYFSPGVHVLTWTATDAASNSASAIQTVNVTPMVEFSKNQTAREGDTVTFKVILNGPAVTYPVTVPYTVGGTAATDGSDHNLVNGSVDITASNLEASVTVNVVDDGAGEGVETLLLSMGSPTNAIAGPVATHTIEIREVNVVPLVSLTADQGSGNTRMIGQGDGNVIVTATVVDSNGDSHTYDWSGTDNSLIDTDSGASTFTFDPSVLTPGVYKMDVVVSDGTDTRRAALRLNVIAAIPTLTASDTDGDGSNDDDEGAGDSDSDGIPDYLDHMGVHRNVVQEQRSVTDQFLMETEPGLALSLGQVAFRANGAKTAVTEEEIEEHANNGTGAGLDESYSYSGGLFDFNVNELPVAGQQVRIVLAQFAAIPADAVYRKLMPTGWQNFVIDANNSVASASGTEGFCPPPGDSSYTNGLTEGHWCVQLTIEDGGPNDTDGEVNQSVDDPGGVAVKTATPVEVTINGSGALSGAWLALLAFAFAYRYVGRSRLLMLLCLSGFVTSAQAESFLKPDYLGLALLKVKSDERSSDFQAEIDALSLTASVSQTDLSRNGWSPFIGYQLYEQLALEIGYVDLGNVTTTVSGVAPDVDTFVNTLAAVYPVTASGWTTDLVLSKALNEQLTGSLTLGAFLWEADYSLSGTNINKKFEDDGVNTHLGLALEYSPRSEVFIRLGWQSYRFSGVNVDAWLIGIGARY